MSDAVSHSSYLPSVLTFCAAAVAMVPLFRHMGQSAVLGYLAAGLVIGPGVLKLIQEADTVRGVAELGVVLLLFLIGLELKISQLLSMRRDIFGLGALQMILCAFALSVPLGLLGIPFSAAFLVGLALSLSATSVALQMLEERGDLASSYGRRAFAVLIFQDLLIIPVLAILPFLSPDAAQAGWQETFLGVTKAFGAIGLVVLIGRYALNPLFHVLGQAGAREIMTAAALLVVLGSAVLMESAGISMAMGAFLAGLLLAESKFRHQLEADIEPFRGILLGLFFMSVGMSIEARVIQDHAWLLVLGALFAIAVKILLVALLLKLSGSPWDDAWKTGAVLSPAGEFAFVLLPLAASSSLLGQQQSQIAVAIAGLTMALGPLAARGVEALLARMPVRVQEPEPEDIHLSKDGVIVIGFGRFGQVVTQVLLSEGIDVTVIDKDVDNIRTAAKFGFKIYYGDGRRIDVLRAAGARKAQLICICTDGREPTSRILEAATQAFPEARFYVRAYDRIHAIDLYQAKADYLMRETFESALAFGRDALETLGRSPEQASSIACDVRKRDQKRLDLQRQEGVMGGLHLLHRNRLEPQPLTLPKEKARPLSPATQDILEEEPRFEKTDAA
jgi:glutathione-regulated potassium-efflux system protein KefB